ALLVDHARDEDARIADDEAARLAGDLAAEMADRALDHRRIFIWMRRNIVVAAIGNAEAAAKVDAADGVSFRAQVGHHLGDTAEGGFKGFERGQLAADMDVD